MSNKSTSVIVIILAALGFVQLANAQCDLSGRWFGAIENETGSSGILSDWVFNADHTTSGRWIMNNPDDSSAESTDASGTWICSPLGELSAQYTGTATSSEGGGSTAYTVWFDGTLDGGVAWGTYYIDFNDAEWDDDTGEWVLFIDSIEEHIFEIEINTGLYYGNPDNDQVSYEFNLSIYTDDAIVKVEFQAPSGSHYEIPMDYQSYQLEDGLIEAGSYDMGGYLYEWYYEAGFNNIAALTAYGDGLYTVYIEYLDGTQDQTTVLFENPETNDPLPQPIQRPVLTNPLHNSTVTSPVDISWVKCDDTAAEIIWIGLEDHDLGESEVYYNLPVSATQLEAPQPLDNGEWEIAIAFAVWYDDIQNDDGIPLSIGKFTETEQLFSIGGASVSGRITDKLTGQPIPNIWVGYWQPDTQTGSGSWTNIDGIYKLEDLNSGELEINVRAGTGYATVGTWLDNLSGNVDNLDFAVPPEAILSGRVLDNETAEPIPNVIVGCWSDRNAVWNQSTTDENGYFWLDSLPPGLAEISIHPNLQDPPDQPDLYAWALPAGADYIYLEEGRYLSKRILTLRKGAYVSGYIKDSQHNPLPDIEYDFDSKMSTGWGRTDSSGMYHLSLPPGRYSIAPDDDELGGMRAAIVNVIDTNQTIEVPDILVYSEETGDTISGIVSNPGGHTLHGPITVVALATDANLHVVENWYTVRGVSETDMEQAGPFTLSALPPGDYDIYLISFYEDPDEIESIIILDIVSDVPAGATGIELSIGSANGTVIGNVTNADDEIVIGANLLLRNEAGDRFFGDGETNANGKFTIYNVSPGTYMATAIHSMYDETSVTIEVTEGQTTNAGTIVLSPSGLKEATDLNGDGITNLPDLAILSGQWLGAGLLDADFDRNDNVGLADLAKIAENWQCKAIWRTGVKPSTLAAKWNMDDNAPNTTVTDSGPNGNNAQAQRNTTALTTTGKVGSALLMDGTADYITAPEMPDLANLPQATWGGWFRFDQPGTVMAAITDATDGRSHGIHKWSNNYLYVYIGGLSSFARSAQITDTQWHHIMVTFDGTQQINTDRVAVYVDGEYFVYGANGTFPDAIDLSGFNIGGLPDGGAGNYYRLMKGAVDEVIIFTRTLQPDEIKEIFEADALTDQLRQWLYRELGIEHFF